MPTSMAFQSSYRRYQTQATMRPRLRLPAPRVRRVLEYPGSRRVKTTWCGAQRRHALLRASVNASKWTEVLLMPVYKGRYFFMPMLDMWTNVFQSPGTRTGYGKGGNSRSPGRVESNCIRPDSRIQAPTSTIGSLGEASLRPRQRLRERPQSASAALVTPLSHRGNSHVPPAGSVDPSSNADAGARSGRREGATNCTSLGSPR